MKISTEDIIFKNANRVVWTVVSCRVPTEVKIRLMQLADSKGMNVNQLMVLMVHRVLSEGKAQLNLFDTVKTKTVKSVKKVSRLDRKQAIDFYGAGKVIEFMKDDGVPVHGLKTKLSNLDRDNGSLTWHGWKIEKLKNKYWVG